MAPSASATARRPTQGSDGSYPRDRADQRGSSPSSSLRRKVTGDRQEALLRAAATGSSAAVLVGLLRLRLRSVGLAASLALARVLTLTPVLVGLASALALAVVLTFACVLGRVAVELLDVIGAEARTLGLVGSPPSYFLRLRQVEGARRGRAYGAPHSWSDRTRTPPSPRADSSASHAASAAAIVVKYGMFFRSVWRRSE